MNYHDLLFNFYLGINLKATLHTHEYVYVCLSYCHSPFSTFFSFLPSAPELYLLSSGFQKLGLQDLKSGTYLEPSLATQVHFSVGKTVFFLLHPYLWFTFALNF